jgi:hypothetical protein
MYIILFIIILFIYIIIDKLIYINYSNYFIETFNNEGLLFCCQGWTDIFNTFGLINYYSLKYSKLYVVLKKEAFDLVNFYIKDLNNIELILVDNINCKKSICTDNEIYNYLKKNNKDILNNSKCLFHGWMDEHRKDKYKDIFSKNMKIDGSNFVNLFYTSYDLSSNIRIDYFIFNRDYDLENITYNNFINKYGEKYILYHSNDDNINFIIDKKPYKYINLNKKTDIFFDYIKILENSIEFHLIDSSWTAFIYLLECKYNLFKNKKIYLYPIRNYTKMFQNPVLLDNWIFIT